MIRIPRDNSHESSVDNRKEDVLFAYFYNGGSLRHGSSSFDVHCSLWFSSLCYCSGRLGDRTSFTGLSPVSAIGGNARVSSIPSIHF